MSKQITIKYYSESESSREPYQAIEGSAGYDLFTAETKTFLPNSVGTISKELRWAVPTDFFGKLFPRSGLLMKYFVTIDAGVTDADFREVVQALVVNHHPDKTFTVWTENRIAQTVFMKKLNANFVKVSDKSLLGITKRGNHGFRSTGFRIIKKLKKDPESELTTSELTTSESDQTTSQNSCKLLAICDKSSDDLQISSEEAIMAVSNEVIVHESITIDE